MSKIRDFLFRVPPATEAEQRNDQPAPTVTFDAPLTPAAVRRATFAIAAIGRRGYDQGEVEAFRLRVARTLETGARNLEDAARRARVYEQETQRLRDVYRQQNSDLEIPKVAPGVSALQDAIEIVSRAEQTGDQIIRQATLQAQTLVATARTRYAQIITDAEEQAHSALADVQARGGSPEEERRLNETILTLRSVAQSTKGQLEGALHGLLAELEQIEVLPLPDGEPVRAR